MNINNSSGADAELLGAVALAIDEYNKITKEISDVDALLDGLFGHLAGENKSGPSFNMSALTQAIFAKVNANENYYAPTTVAQEGADAGKKYNLYLPNSDYRKPMDAMYEAVWQNTQFARLPQALMASIERNDLKYAESRIREYTLNDWFGRNDEQVGFVGNNPRRSWLEPRLRFFYSDEGGTLTRKYYSIGMGGVITVNGGQAGEHDDLPVASALLSLLNIVSSLSILTSPDNSIAKTSATSLMLVSQFASAIESLRATRLDWDVSRDVRLSRQVAGIAGAASFAMLFADEISKMQADGRSNLQTAQSLLQMTYFATNIVRNVQAVMAARLVQDYFYMPVSTAGMNFAGATAHAAASILGIIDGANKGASAGLLAAQSAELFVKISSGIMLAMAPLQTTPVGALVGSMFSPVSVYQAVMFQEAVDEAMALYGQTNWEGDKIRAEYYADMRNRAIFMSVPLLNAFGGLFDFGGYLSTSGSAGSRSANLLARLGINAADGEAAVTAAVKEFLNEGFDSREIIAQRGHVDAIQRIAATTDAKRVVAVTGQETRSDMATFLAATGGVFLANASSNRNFIYDSADQTIKANGLIGQRLGSDVIDISSKAESQYFLFLTPAMPISGEERDMLSSGKKRTSKASLVADTLFTIVDGATNTVANAANVASQALKTGALKNGQREKIVGKQGGLAFDLGAGDDVVLAAARAMYVDAGADYDGVDYRSALTAFKADVPALDVSVFQDNAAGLQGYRVNKAGFGTFHDVELQETTIQEGKETRTVVTRKIVTVKDYYSDSQVDLLVGVEWVHGTSHDDKMTGGEAADIFLGGDGNNTLSGNGGDDQLISGKHNDTLNGGEGFDLVMAGAGNDYLHDTGTNVSPVTVEGAVRSGDTLIGGEGSDTVRAGGGNDLIFGDDAPSVKSNAAPLAQSSGVNYNDYLFGNAGNDTIDGGFGNDSVEGGEGDDQIFGGDGNDTLRGGTGKDSIWGGNGNDTIYGGDAASALYGDEGNDYLYAGSAGSLLLGGAGNDTLMGSTGHDILIGGAGSDILRGGEGSDILFDDSADRNAPNHLYGEGGNDIIVTANLTFSDVFDGGAGTDTLSFRFMSKGVDANIESRTASSVGTTNPVKDTVRSIEWLEGSEHDDVLTGNSGDNRLIGRGGNDTLVGGANKDALFGGAGRDELYGGTGVDLIDGGEGDDYIFGNGGDTMFFSGHFGRDLVQAESGADLSGSLFIFTGIDYRNLFFVRDGDSLVVRREQIVSGVDKSEYMGHAGVLIKDYFAGANSSKVAFADQNGSALAGLMVLTLVSAMADAQTTGFGGSGYADFMQPVLQNAWTLTAAA
ncbi:hypothetical protein FPY71_03780 [Aureimonas fodinaquatilis]|uniref:Cyclic nucleotide-binding domain-containing protein n=1 Tax=Aureimonas fodinaquatilis TaxID=2565783 RepID=A0A5B0E0T2_9HYPH|nr:hypothetical protein [Aureimonas fodinaquatilis]KAA0972238.1 hypothetical protein FPY71_03780 [Aureimonas fodinaquatilis]